MQKTFKILTIFIILLFSQKISAQNFNLSFFDVEQGLSSNLIKDILQDNSGYIWLATDAGISRFDGKKFTNFVEGLPSFLIKDLEYTPDGKIIVVTDMGVGFLEKNHINYFYKPFLEGSASRTKSKLFFPKTIFFHNNEIWFGDNSAAVKYENGKLKVYEFEKKFLADKYFRTFNFVEDKNNNLIVSSSAGILFRYDKIKDEFVELPFKPNIPKENAFSIDKMELVNDGSIVAATSIGIMKINFSNDYKKSESKLIAKVKRASYFVFDKKGNMFISSWFDGLHYFDTRENKLTKIENVNFSIISKLDFDREGNLWICSDEGLGVIKDPVFQSAEFNNTGFVSYIINVVNDKKGNIYFTDQESIFKSTGNEISETVIDDNGDLINSFAVDNNKIWFSRKGKLHLKTGSKINTFFEDEIISPDFLSVDESGDLWVYIRNTNSIVNLNEERIIKKHPVSDLNENSIGLDILKILSNGKYLLLEVETLKMFIFTQKLTENLNFFLANLNLNQNYQH